MPLWTCCGPLGWHGGLRFRLVVGSRFPASAGIPRSHRFARSGPFDSRKGRGSASPPLNLPLAGEGRLPMERGCRCRPAPLDSGFRRNDSGVAGMMGAWGLRCAITPLGRPIHPHPNPLPSRERGLLLVDQGFVGAGCYVVRV